MRERGVGAGAHTRRRLGCGTPQLLFRAHITLLRPVAVLLLVAAALRIHIVARVASGAAGSAGAAHSFHDHVTPRTRRRRACHFSLE